MARRTLRTSGASQQVLFSRCLGRQHTGLGPGLCKRNVQRPLLPAYILFCPAKEVGLLPLLLEELHHKLPSPSLLVCAFYSADQRNGLLLDERLEVDIVNGGEGEVEQVAGQRRYGGEVAVEEDGV